MKVEVDANQALRLLSPRPTVLVTAVDERGRPNVITLAWTMPTSFDPPLVAISVGVGRLSHELIERSKEFVVNVPGMEMLEKVWICGRISGRSIDKFKHSGLTPVPSKNVKAPRIGECTAHLECELVNRLRTGDHTIFIGRVLAASVDEGAFDAREGIMELETFKPMFHLGGANFSTASGSTRAE